MAGRAGGRATRPARYFNSAVVNPSPSGRQPGGANRYIQTSRGERAVLGAVRAAVLEEQPFLRSRSFEDELVRMIVAYLGAITDAAGPGRNRTTA